jgi:hypothetical protein
MAAMQRQVAEEKQGVKMGGKTFGLAESRLSELVIESFLS